jgi:hypothetical protein
VGRTGSETGTMRVDCGARLPKASQMNKSERTRKNSASLFAWLLLIVREPFSMRLKAARFPKTGSRWGRRNSGSSISIFRNRHLSELFPMC